MTPFRRDYDKVIDNFGGNLAGQQAGAQVDAYAERVEGALDVMIQRMRDLACNEKGIHYAKGDVAEAWHAGAFNVDAMRRGIDARATLPRDASEIDIVLNGSRDASAQVKYYRNPDATAKAIGAPKYAEVDQKIVPADQINDVRIAARGLADKNAVTRPEVAAAHENTFETVDDRIRMDGAESLPLTEREALELVKQLRENGDIDRERFGLSQQQVLKMHDIVRECGSAAVRAAAISAALHVAPYLLEIAIKTWETGEIRAKDFEPLARSLPGTMLRSGMAGGISASIVGYAARAGLQRLDPTLVAACVALGISAVETSFDVARGNTTWPVAAKRISDDALVLAIAAGGGALGQTFIPIPVLGALIGNLVGGFVARVLLEKRDRAVLGLAVDTGWTFFGLVTQDYTVPPDILEAAGWKVFEPQRFVPQRFEFKRFEPLLFEPKKIEMNVLRRGVVSINRIGYLA